MKLVSIATLMLLMCISLTTTAQEDITTVTIEFVDDSYGEHQEFAQRAAQHMQEVINSDEFAKRFLKLRMGKKGGYTNQQILDLLRNGFEKQCPQRITYTEVAGADCPDKTINQDINCPEGEPGVIDLKVRTLNLCDGSKWVNKNCKLDSSAGTIGIDGSGDGVTAICPQRLELWVGRNDIAELAGHYTHEYMHILGFSHAWMIRKRRSAVYKIGYLVRDMINERQAADL